MRVSWRWWLIFAIVVGLAAGCSSGSSKARELAPSTSTSTATSAKGKVPAPDAKPAGRPTGALGNAPAKTAPAASKKAPASRDTTGKPVPGQYIVTLKPGGNPRSVAAIAKVEPKYIYENAVLGFAAKLNAGQLNALRHNQAVQEVTQDGYVTASTWVTQPIDRTTAQPWGLDRIDQQRDLTYTYWSNAGVGVTAYIIDSGIATADTDFGGRATDVYDAFGQNGQDCNGHGTHVAGTVGGTRFGVAKRVNLRGVRVLDCAGSGSWASIIAGIDWVRGHAVKPAVANISIGCTNAAPCINTTVDAATTNLVNSGVFVSVAAGNFNVDACNGSPARAAGTITVAAMDYTDTKASYSNWGQCVDLYAPGTDISSDWLANGARNDSGTSMASPHVTGVAALLKADYGDQTSATIATWIKNAARPNLIKSNPTGTPNKLLYMYGW
jgi:subtilisin family serine protease